MRRNVWQVQTAKNKLSEVITLAESGTPQLITKNAKPSVYVINAEYFEFLGKKKTFKEMVLSRPQKEIELVLSRN